MTQAGSIARHEVTLTRVFDAPRALVFRAWIDGKQLAQWWGPKSFTNPVCEIDARPGGAIRIDMTAPDGTVFPMKGTVREVAAPEHLVFSTTAFEDGEGPARLEGLTTVTFAEQGGKTQLTVHSVIVRSTPDVAGAVAGMEEGWRQSLDRLADLVARTAR